MKQRRRHGAQQASTFAPPKRSQFRRVARHMRELCERVDEVMARAMERYTVSCQGKGCADCCRQAFLSTVPEAISVLVPLVYNPPLGVSFGTIERRISKTAKLAHDPSYNLGRWFADRVACPLLRSDEACLVYEQRPVACRTYAVVSPREDCAVDGNVEKIKIRGAVELLTITSARAAQELGVPLGLAPFPVALEWALVAIMHGPRTLERQLERTPFSHELASALYWGERFGDPRDYRKMLEELESWSAGNASNYTAGGDGPSEEG